MADPVLVRAAAAVELLRSDPAVDGPLLLSYAVWPTLCLEKVPARYAHRPIDAAELERMRGLADAGFSHREIGAQLGRPKATVGMMFRRSR